MAFVGPGRGIQTIRRRTETALGSFPSRSFYVDATGGSDAAAGTTPDTAKQTIAWVNDATFRAGDRVLFKTGETWNEWLEMFADYVLPVALTFSTYGSGVAPIINGVEDVTDFGVSIQNITQYNGTAKYAGTASAGLADGTSWDNRWAYGSVGWAGIQTLIDGGSNVYLFLDQGTYTSEWDIGASGTSDTVRLYIMPGYAAEQLGVPGTHTGHIGQVIFDLAGASANGIDLNGQSYITVDGYGDPRPSAGNNPKLIVRDIDDGTKALISGWNTSSIIIRNVEVYQTTNTDEGDGIKFNKAAPAVTGNHIVEYCYIHDGGYWTGAIYYAAIWIDYYDDCTVRYNEFVDWGNGNNRAGEGAGFFVGHQTGEQVYGNLFINVGVGVRSAGLTMFNTFHSCEKCVVVNNTLSQDIYIENNILNSPAGNAIEVTGADDCYVNTNVIYDRGDGIASIHSTYYAAASNLNAEVDAALFIENNNIDEGSAILVNVPTNCRLRATASNEIDTAYTVNWTPTKDQDRRKLPVGTDYDIGAYEYVV